MSVTHTPATTTIVCDCCGTEGYQQYHGCTLTVGRAALDFQGQPVADASVVRDLCPSCTDIVVAAINKASEIANRVKPSEEELAWVKFSKGGAL